MIRLRDHLILSHLRLRAAVDQSCRIPPCNTNPNAPLHLKDSFCLATSNWDFECHIDDSLRPYRCHRCRDGVIIVASRNRRQILLLAYWNVTFHLATTTASADAAVENVLGRRLHSLGRRSSSNGLLLHPLGFSISGGRVV